MNESNPNADHENPTHENPTHENSTHDEFDSNDAQSVENASDQAYQTYDSDVQPSDAPETRDEEMMRLRREVDAADKRVLQAQAEAENFRKRMRRDYEDQLKFASMPLINDILQVRDNLVRAIEAAATTGDQSVTEGLRDGVAMVAKQFDDTLAKHSVEAILTDGEEFDPNFHEAISQMPHPEIEANHIAHVAVTGFKMHGRVIRPTQVVVSTGPS